MQTHANTRDHQPPAFKPFYGVERQRGHEYEIRRRQVEDQHVGDRGRLAVGAVVHHVPSDHHQHEAVADGADEKDDDEDHRDNRELCQRQLRRALRGRIRLVCHVECCHGNHCVGHSCGVEHLCFQLWTANDDVFRRKNEEPQRTSKVN